MFKSEMKQRDFLIFPIKEVTLEPASAKDIVMPMEGVITENYLESIYNLALYLLSYLSLLEKVGIEPTTSSFP